MKLGIDISQVVYQGTGVARFTDGLVRSILDYDKNNHWTFFFSGLRQSLPDDLEEKIKNSRHKLIRVRFPPTALAFFWNDLHRFKIDKIVGRLDWFITSDWAEPPATIKKVTIVHDLVYLRYPETVAQSVRSVQKKRLDWVKKESKIIFTDSQSTKTDLINLKKIAANRIKILYPGVRIEKPDTETIARILKKYGLDKPFIFTVGKLEPRKNLNRLAEAYTKLGLSELDLVIAGPKGWGPEYSSIRDQKQIRFLGLISDEELYSLYSACLFFVFPSIWEGFGYPVVEAMKLSTAITCSNSSSIKEITGNAVLFFNPENINDISGCLKRMSENRDLRESLIKKGLEQSKIFSWEIYYKELIKILL